MPINLRENCLQDCLDDLAKRWREAFQRKGMKLESGDLSKRFEVAFRRKGARLETEFEPSIPNFRFDYLKVQQAAANLLDHALRQAPSSSTVTLHCLSRPEGVEVSLTGATEHDREVFDKCPTPYSRPHHQESLDVGLSIVERLILAHGGRIWVEPSPTGSKFVFLLPMDAS